MHWRGLLSVQHPFPRQHRRPSPHNPWRRRKKRSIHVPRENVFFDQAVKGFKRHREGLDRLREVLRKKAVGVVMFFATNRLFRKVHSSLQFVEEEVVERGIRAIFVKSGVDTEDTKRWRTMLSFNSTIDEFTATMYADNVRAAHEGLLERRCVCGLVTYGYRGEEIPGKPTRRGRPRQQVVIDPAEREVVTRIFNWYVVDRVSIIEILQRLNNDPSLPRRNVGTMWTRGPVRNMLRNTRYRGLWKYGVKETIWVSSKDSARQIPRPEPLKELHFEELRIISDEIWYGAQERLAEEHGTGGRKPGDGNEKSRPKILNGLLWCPEHGRALHVHGPHGHQMVCPDCEVVKPEKRALYSQLNRVLAVQLTCEKLAELVRGDSDLVREIIAGCQAAALAMQQPDLEDLDRLQAQEKTLTTRIRYIMGHVGATEAEQHDAEAVRHDLARQREEVTAKIGMLQAAKQRQIVVPTEEEVVGLLKRLGEILLAAARQEYPEGAGRVRQIITLFMGGRIDLYQCGEKKAQRGWLQGRFRVPLLSVLVEQAVGAAVSTPDEAVEVVIDYVRPVAFAEDAERAYALYRDGGLHHEIARELGCLRSNITKLLKYACAEHGEEWIDGRTLRWKRPRGVKPPKYELIADQVKALMDEKILLQEIGERLGVGRDEVTAAKKYWYASRGLPIPDGRSRRKELDRKVSHPRRTARRVTTENVVA